MNKGKHFKVVSFQLSPRFDFADGYCGMANGLKRSDGTTAPWRSCRQRFVNNTLPADDDQRH